MFIFVGFCLVSAEQKSRNFAAYEILQVAKIHSLHCFLFFCFFFLPLFKDHIIYIYNLVFEMFFFFKKKIVFENIFY